MIDSIVIEGRKGPKDLVIKRRPLTDATGKRFGRLTAVSYSGFSKTAWRSYWKCRCDCGRVVVIGWKELVVGNTKSCGCLAAEIVSNNQWQGVGELSRHHW